MVGLLERIRTEVEDLGYAKWHEWFRPDIEAMRTLLLEDDLPPPVCAALNVSNTLSSEKLPTFWLGGNSLNVARYFATISCAGTTRNIRSKKSAALLEDFFDHSSS